MWNSVRSAQARLRFAPSRSRALALSRQRSTNPAASSRIVPRCLGTARCLREKKAHLLSWNNIEDELTRVTTSFCLCLTTQTSSGLWLDAI